MGRKVRFWKMNMDGITKVTSFLNQLGIQYKLLRHPAVITTDEAAKVIHVDGCMACKNLYVKDKKSDNFYMLVLPYDKRAEMRGLAAYVGCAKFEFATEEKLFADLQVHRGSVSPFAYLNENPNKPATMIIDRAVWEAPLVKFHPCDNTATVVLAGEDFHKYIEAIGKKYVVAE